MKSLWLELMKKKEIVDKIVEHLRKKVSLHMQAAKTAHAEATHEENVAEDKYDTRGLEASYLAAGQSRQMAEVAASHQEYASLFIKKFKPGEAIDVSALVELESRGEKHFYFFGPSAGGVEVEHQGKTIMVVTPQSPLGEKLEGRKKGETFKMKIGPFEDEYTVLSVS